MEKSPIARLPPELRNQIYELVLINPAGIIIKERDLTMRLTASGAHTSLLETCREIRTDVIQMFYGSNKFVVQEDYFKEQQKTWYEMKGEVLRLWATWKWLRAIGPKNRSYLRTLVIDLGQVSLRAISPKFGTLPSEATFENRLSLIWSQAIPKSLGCFNIFKSSYVSIAFHMEVATLTKKGRKLGPKHANQLRMHLALPPRDMSSVRATMLQAAAAATANLTEVEEVLSYRGLSPHQHLRKIHDPQIVAQSFIKALCEMPPVESKTMQSGVRMLTGWY